MLMKETYSVGTNASGYGHKKKQEPDIECEGRKRGRKNGSSSRRSA